MQDLYLNKVKKQLELLNRAMQIADRKIDNTVTGSLRTKRQKNKIYYYHGYYKDGKRIEKFIGNDDVLITKLAQNSYYKNLKKVLQKEISALQSFNTLYDPTRKYLVYEQMPEDRKRFVIPLFISSKEKFDSWEKEEWTQYKGHPETLRHDTDAGHKVRSKSEKTIANLLYRHRDVLSYRYEQEIFLKESNIYVHPDFIIRNRLTGKIFYWEHVGMLDRMDYANDFVSKMNAYTLEGMFPADNFLISFETASIADNNAVENKFLQILLMG